MKSSDPNSAVECAAAFGVPIPIVEIIAAYYRREYAGVIPDIPGWGYDIFLRMHTDFREGDTYVTMVAEAFSQRGQRILDVGTASGRFVVAARRAGYDAHGVDVDAALVTVGQFCLRRAGDSPARVLRAEGERLPYRDGAFDLVTMFTLLEHAPRTRALLQEALRVLRVGGKLLMTAPNYLCGWEPHYNVFLPFGCPRPLARWYLARLGRKPAFLDSLTYTTPRLLRRSLKGLPVTICDLGLREWIRELQTCESRYRSPFALAMFRRIRRCGLTGAAAAAGRLGFFTPLKYVLTKER